tara:strand:+ start:1481 stop:1849 length:369 start_codon:yes stop_codon:yes gene_type:complete
VLISIKELKQIIKKQLVEAADPLRVELEKDYPKSVALTDDSHEDSDYISWTSLNNAKEPLKYLEKIVIYHVITSKGSTVMWPKLGKIILKIRKLIPGGDILKAFENNSDLIYDALVSTKHIR